jgi:hypothetical protein
MLASHGAGAEDVGPIWHLAPFSHAWTIEWTGRWSLTSWQNGSITIALIDVALALALNFRASPCEPFSTSADRKVVDALGCALELAEPPPAVK